MDSSSLAAFVFWLPRELATTDWQLIACSRLSRSLLDAPLLVDAVRSVAEGLISPTTALLYSPRFILASHLRALSRKLKIPLVHLSRIPKSANASWFHKQATKPPASLTDKLYYFDLPKGAPPGALFANLPEEALLNSAPQPFEVSESSCDSPVDWIATHLARRVHLVSLRPAGNMEAAIRHRIQVSIHDRLAVRVLEAPRLTPAWLLDEIVQAGATRWIRSPATQPKTITCCRLVPQQTCQAGSSLICPSEPSGDFLFHWTRAAEVSRQVATDEVLARLFFETEQSGCGNAAHTGIDSLQRPVDRLLLSLLRILGDLRLRATGRWTRDRRPVVSLTAQPLDAWRTLRTYRSHLGRWDFEPCGLGLSRAMVQSLGGRPVVYGDEQKYLELPASERTYFQLASSRGPTRVVDWTVEREWRVPDDIDLRQFAANEAFVFVPTRTAAESAARLSRWPVFAIPDDYSAASLDRPGLQITIAEAYNAAAD